jgi:hypothetical protein
MGAGVDQVLVSSMTLVGGLVACAGRVAALRVRSRTRVELARIEAEGLSSRLRSLPPGMALEESVGEHTIKATYSQVRQAGGTPHGRRCGH